MTRIKRLFYLLLLNALVSATTTLAVLYFWDKAKAPAPAPIVLVITLTTSNTSPSSPTEPTAVVETPQPTSANLEPTATLFTVRYQVKEGDTLSSIAVLYQASLSDIMTVNGLSDPNLISVGEILFIPTTPLPTETPVPTTAAPTVTATPSPKYTPLPTTTSTRTPNTQTAVIKIEAVIGIGSIDQERVIIVHAGGGDVSLAGWRLEDEDGNVYIFPQLELSQGARVQIHTVRGDNTVTDLYWGLSFPVWKAGEQVVLKDSLDNPQSVFRIP